MRTKPNKTVQVNESVSMTGTLTSRFGLANTMGVSFNGMRNLYDVLGYSTELTFRDFLAQYVRHGIAKAIINRPIQRTWKGDVLLIESDDDKETLLETAWVELENELKIKSKLIRLDKLTGLGQYGILLLGFNDVKTNEDLIKPILKAKTNKLLYVKPFSQNDALIETYVTDATNHRYGLPLLYAINIGNADGTAQSTIRVHYTRVIHVVDEPLESDIASCSRLEVVFNNLKDLEKIVGGSAEMFWKGARPGHQADVKDGYTMGPVEKAALEDQFDEYEHNLRRILQTKGIELKELDTQVSDPKTHVDIQLMMISAVTNIPVRILVGSERGELSSGQDADEWNAYCTSRRKEFAEPYIVRPLVDRLISVGALPASGNKDNLKKYTVQWEELFTQSEKDKVDVGKIRSEAIKNYVGAESVMPPEAFYEFCLGMTQDQITLVMEMIDQYKIKEQKELDEEEKIRQEYLKQGLDENGNSIPETEDNNTDEENELEVNGGPGSGPRPGGGKGSKKKSSGGSSGSGDGDTSGKVENTTDFKRIGLGEFTTEKNEKVKKLEELTGIEFKLYQQTGSHYGYSKDTDTEIRISNHPSKFVEKRNAEYKKALDLNYEVETTTNMYNKIKGVNPYAGMKEGTKLIHRRKESVGEVSFISHDKGKEAVTVKIIKGGTSTKTGETKVYYDDMFNFYDKD
jgi:hypothetical protein